MKNKQDHSMLDLFEETMNSFKDLCKDADKIINKYKTNNNSVDQSSMNTKDD